MPGYPYRTREVCLMDEKRAFTFVRGVDAENNEGGLLPSRSLGSRIEQPQIRPHMRVVVTHQPRVRRRHLRDGRFERWGLHVSPVVVEVPRRQWRSTPKVALF